nr:hypothetical protein [Spirulina subsalsa]
MMELWRLWWQTIVLSSQHNPPRFIEALMLSLAIAFLLILLFTWRTSHQWPYLVLSLSYGIGASVSILVREAYSGSSPPRFTPVMGVISVSLLILIWGLMLVVQDAF